MIIIEVISYLLILVIFSKVLINNKKVLLFNNIKLINLYKYCLLFLILS